jgi:uncharacterized protein (UPF0210 family)
MALSSWLQQALIPEAQEAITLLFVVHITATRTVTVGLHWKDCIPLTSIDIMEKLYELLYRYAMRLQ